MHAAGRHPAAARYKQAGVIDMTTAVISDSPEARGRTSPPQRPAATVAALGREAERQIVADLLRRAQRGQEGWSSWTVNRA